MRAVSGFVYRSADQRTRLSAKSWAVAFDRVESMLRSKAGDGAVQNNSRLKPE
jgi:hypothetical protein